MHEHGQYDFLCGRAYGGSRIAIVSMARYHLDLDGKQGVGGEPPDVCLTDLVKVLHATGAGMVIGTRRLWRIARGRRGFICLQLLLPGWENGMGETGRCWVKGKKGF